MTEKIHPLAMPIAVFAAGVLIAAAVFFSDGTSAERTNNQGNNTPPETSEITLPAPSEDDYFKGSLDAEIIIVEYSDPECPFCKRFHDTMNQIVSEYDSGEVAWVYRHFPVNSLHPNATTVSHAFECAGELGGNDGFWNYADELFRVSPSLQGGSILDATSLSQIAEDVGLSSGDFQSCMNSERHIEKIQNQYNDAITAAQSAGDRPGTPYSVVIIAETGEKFTIRGAQEFATVKSQIDAILNQ